jgi:hypothetical protein
MSLLVGIAHLTIMSLRHNPPPDNYVSGHVKLETGAGTQMWPSGQQSLGRLYVTEVELTYVPGMGSLDAKWKENEGPITIPLNEIATIRRQWGLIDPALIITRHSGDQDRFVARRQKRTQQSIEQAVKEFVS